MCIILYATGKVSINKIVQILNMCWSLVYRWINETAEKFRNYKIKDNIKETEFDEMWHFLYKKHKLWVIKTLDRSKNKMIAWVAGSR